MTNLDEPQQQAYLAMERLMGDDQARAGVLKQAQFVSRVCEGLTTGFSSGLAVQGLREQLAEGAKQFLPTFWSLTFGFRIRCSS